MVTVFSEPFEQQVTRLALTTMSTLLAFKAGRAFRRPGTNFVDPEATKGAISLANGDDGLLHFMWKNRETNEVEEDLILFPSDASLVKVPQVNNARVYVLKFSSSDQRHFFWMQDASSTRDDEFTSNVNGLLEDPTHNLVWGNAASSSSSQAAPSAQGSTTFTQEQLAQFTQLIQGAVGGGTTASPEMALTDILTPANLAPLFREHPELIPALFPHLPPDLPVPPSPEVLQRIISSPQFRSAVSNLDQALRTGLLGNLVRGLGLPEEAGTGIEPFMRAVQEQADHDASTSGESSRMDTD